MKTLKILIISDIDWTDYVPADTEDITYRLVYVPCKASDEDIVSACPDADMVLLDAIGSIGASAIERMPNLKLIQSQGVGFQGVDVEAASRHHIPVCNCRAMNAGAVAEHAVMLMFGLLRDIVNNDNVCRQGRQIEVKTKYIKSGAIRELGECTIGLLGFGAIAKGVARIAGACGARVIYYDVYRASEEVERDYNVTYVGLDDLAGMSDILSIHVPLMPATERMVNADFLAKMKPGSYVVNTARGGVVDGKALLEALKSGQLAGAGLDCVENEPLYADDYMLTADPEVERKIIFSPHIAGITGAAFRRAAEIVKKNVSLVAAGEMPVNINNKW